jgi:hypothetical protein
MEPKAPSVGARVKLHSLQQKPEHNGVEGEVLEFDASAGRWKVQLHPDGLVLALKASNLEVLGPAELMCGADVEIHSLVRSPELNGVRGKVVEPQDHGRGRWGVKIDSDGRILALKPANLVLISCPRVALVGSGLSSGRQYLRLTHGFGPSCAG